MQYLHNVIYKRAVANVRTSHHIQYTEERHGECVLCLGHQIPACEFYSIVTKSYTLSNSPILAQTVETVSGRVTVFLVQICQAALKKNGF